MNTTRIARQLASTAGSEILEAALVLPLLFMLLLGIVWFGRAFNIYSTIQQAVQQGAIAAARPTCATCGNDFSRNRTVDTTIDAVMQASNLDPTQIQFSAPPNNQITCMPSLPYSESGCHQRRNIWVCRNVLLNQVNGSLSTNQPAQCGSVVSFQYPFQFYLPFTSLNMQQIMLSAQAQSRMEN
ncbi:MAG: TadE/TadG family type IV pilus assembly protein [Terriglobales bacterium]|jgi:hypothetical protein